MLHLLQHLRCAITPGIRRSMTRRAHVNDDSAAHRAFRGLRTRRPPARMLALCGVLLAGFAHADERAAPTVSLELNKLDQSGPSCRAFLVARNASQEALQSLRLDLVVFNQEDIIERRLAVEMGPLRAEKTVVKTFAIEDVACDDVGQLLLNDVIACDGAAGPVADCLARIETTSRQAAPFIK